MSIAAVSNAQTNQTAGSSAITQSTAKAALDYDSFLKLLVAEMSNQDPLNPTDSKEYIAQFASFSNVEQAIQTNRRLDSMMAVSALTQADALIGRTLTSPDGSVSGTVESLKVVQGGIQATLDDGSTMLLGNGVTVS